MKRFLAILVLFAMIISVYGCSIEEVPEETTPDSGKFEIYLADTESVRQFGYYDYENLTLSDEPVLTGDDIRKYFWESHVLELNGAFVEELSESNNSDYSEYVIDEDGFRSYPKGGSKFLDSAQYMAFVIVVDGKKIISGTFPGSPVMPVEDEVLVLGDISDDRMMLLFKGDGFDIRNQDEIYDYFDSMGKISEIPLIDSSSVIEDLRSQLEISNKNYMELEEMYNALRENSGNSSTGEKALQALIAWQKARLDLYIIETQEGERHKLFCDMLSSLDLAKIESLAVAADYFRQTAGADFYINDRMFNVFEEFYNTVIAGLPDNYSMGDINEAFIDKARSIGINVNISNGYIEASPVPSFLRANFELFLSPILNEYLILRDRELAIIFESDHIVASDDENLYISIDQVADLVYQWKKFSDSYPNNYPFNIKARLKAEDYLAVYIGKTGFSVSPLYDRNTLELLPEAKASYLRFLSDYKDSAYYSLMADLFIVLEGSGFKLDSDVTNFIESIDFSQYGY